MKLISQHTVISVPVSQQEQALHFYVDVLGLIKQRDLCLGPELRLLTVAVKDQPRPELALARVDAAFHSEQRVRDVLAYHEQHVAVAFVTEHLYEEYKALRTRGVTFTALPAQRAYGLSTTFVDPDGNPFLLLESTPALQTLFMGKRFGTAA